MKAKIIKLQLGFVVVMWFVLAFVFAWRWGETAFFAYLTSALLILSMITFVEKLQKGGE